MNIDERLREYRKQAASLRRREASKEEIERVLREMEAEFSIPPAPDNEWNREHKEIVRVYRDIASIRVYHK
ncbi:hypothetical protein [Alkalicoccus luteus]|uniref:Uncharacterized protein n=1 Tax=Alkalicoccus luteus TaxID=1237094 RepID=A0A969PV63_9BACI|nr:hypothetical protein [Alkalicoccus luteus]NJP36257.1 hypothetical protein [Alkalicoccus luteus]